MLIHYFHYLDPSPQSSPRMQRSPRIKRERSQDSPDKQHMNKCKKLKSEDFLTENYNRYMDILIRLFPGQKRDILEVVLRSCDGDFAQAIECILANNEDTLPKGQSMYRSPTFHPLPSSLSFIQNGIPPFSSPPFPAIPLRPICTKPNCNCYSYDSITTTPKIFKDLKSPFSTLGLNFNTRNAPPPYFHYPHPAFLSLPENRENGHAKAIFNNDIRERVETSHE